MSERCKLQTLSYYTQIIKNITRVVTNLTNRAFVYDSV